MYDIKWIREHPEAFKRGLKRRGLDSEDIYEELIRLDVLRREHITRVQQWQEDRNRLSAQIGAAKKAGDQTLATELMEKVSRLKSDIAIAAEQPTDESKTDIGRKLAQIPNMPADDVPAGVDASKNVEHHQFGKKRDYSFKPKQHFELGEALGMMDFELAAKLSGARFVVLQKGLARMERALGQLFLDVHTSEKHGYTEVSPPLLVRDDVMFGTGQLPKFEEDQFFTDPRTPGWAEEIAKWISKNVRHTLGAGSGPFSREAVDGMLANAAESAAAIFMLKDFDTTHDWGDGPTIPRRLGLIPTAEVPLTNLVRESIVDEDKLPMRLTACTPCFRAEAGAAGKDTRGMIRQHQFTKVELVSIVAPDKSKAEHERMLACAEEVLKKLDLHYRVVTLCTGDMGFASQKTYDIEVWLPGQNLFREISSCSNCGEFQARRMNARYRGKDGVRHVHTLNGSGVAVGRALIAVMENYQDENGAIAVPDALKPYMGGITRIEKAN